MPTIRLPFLAIVALGAGVAIGAPGGEANAQMLGQMMSQIAGPFAGRMGAAGVPMSPLYGSQAGAAAHLLQGTDALLMSGDGGSLRADMQMAASSESGGSGQGRSAGGDKPDAPEADGEKPWEVLIGACAGGAFIGGFSAASAVAPTGVAAAALPAVASAMAIGCGVGMATAGVSLTAVIAWRKAGR